MSKRVRTDTEARVQSSYRSKEAKRAFIRGIKESTPCADCGRIFHFAAMQFDHIPGRGPKEFSIGNGPQSKSLAAIEAEIAKCEVVCANCHAVRTHIRRSI